MFVRTLCAAVAAATLASCAGTPAAPTQATVDAHVARATSLAGDDLKYLLPVCNPSPGAASCRPLPSNNFYGA